MQKWHYSHCEPWEDCLCHCSLSDTDQSRRAFQVRNLCYMVTRRERMKHTLCDLQEKIFHLQIQLLEEDIAGGETQPFYYTFIYLFCFLHNLLQSRGRCTRGRQHSRFHHKRGVERKEKTNRGAGKAEVAHSSWLKCSGWTVLEEACHRFCTLGHTWHVHRGVQLNAAHTHSQMDPLCTHHWPHKPFTPPPLAAGRSDRLLYMLLPAACSSV